MGLNLVNFVFGSFDHFLAHRAQHFHAQFGSPSSLRHPLADSSLHIERYSGFFGFRVKKLYMSWLAGELCYGTSSIIGCEIGQAMGIVFMQNVALRRLHAAKHMAVPSWHPIASSRCKNADSSKYRDGPCQAFSHD